MPGQPHRAPRTLRERAVPVLSGVLVVVFLVSVAAAVRWSVGPDQTPSAAMSDPTRPVAPSTTATAATAMSLPPRRVLHARELKPIPVATAAPEKAQALAGRATRLARHKQQAVPEAPAPFDVRIGTFNVLGSQHTAPGGDRQHFPPASTRSAGAADVISKHGVDILGTQELQDDQLRDITNRTGLAAWPGLQWGTAETDNSILYDASRFEFVSGSSFTIPFMGRPRPQPILRLRERATGREIYVVNTHPSAHDGRYLAERRRGQATLVSVVNQLEQSGLPVFVTGDMNDREEFYCRVVPPAHLVAPNGGSYGAGCQPPPSPLPVDWVVGSAGISWSGYWRDTTPVTRKISDHFIVSASAHVD